ncbi:hypothetical protein KV102_04485 [Mumia sp. zg.B53]|uniref:hypothetical protein n=1 Tax=Mumia sp. zg.B53 TaxID=2855449 RepID=UPI001C6DD968|nr:hypothetical protein [Mumia sp. zg.B53]MBW9214091.1 hypothetical protein [Mumia sp. zg.B53]
MTLVPAEPAPAPKAARAVARTWRVDPTTVVLVLAAAHVLLKLALMPIALRTPLQGDETAYHAAAEALADAVRALLGGDEVATSQLQAAVIYRGWFMPGMALLLTPLYLVAPDPGLEAGRLYVGALTLVVFLLGVAAVSRLAGRKYAAALLVFPGLVPLWVLFSYTSWGDLAAGLLLIPLVAVLLRAWRRLDRGEAVRLRDGILVGLLLVSTLYLRSSVLPLVVAVLLLSALTVAFRTRGVRLAQSLAACAVAAATFALLLFPWSYSMSNAFGKAVVTTTTVPISTAYAFGDRDALCLGPCPPGNPWYAMTDFASAEAERTGQNELDVQQQMADHALRDVTLRSYATDVLDNFSRYTLDPTGYEPLFRVKREGEALGLSSPGTVSETIVWTTRVLYFTVLGLAALGLLLVRRVSRVPQVVGLLAGLLGGALMSQPFVHVCSPRYWPVFAPLMALAAAGLAVRATPAASSRWLRILQIAVAVGWVAVFVGLGVVAG